MHRYVVVGLSLAMAACASGKSSEGSMTGSPTGSAAGSTAGSMGSAASGGKTIQAKLDSQSEVPPPTVGSSTPSGTVMITINPDSLAYKVTAMGLTSPVTAAHIHLGEAGKAGAVIAPLTISPGSDPSTASGEGTIEASAIKGKNADGSPMTMKDLMSALQSGGTYVNVHTQNNKPGEIRGQIAP
jgi:hypothetical protein